MIVQKIIELNNQLERTGNKYYVTQYWDDLYFPNKVFLFKEPTIITVKIINGKRYEFGTPRYIKEWNISDFENKDTIKELFNDD